MILFFVSVGKNTINGISKEAVSLLILIEHKQ